MDFSCPNCGALAAQTEEREADIHSGAIHHCDECKGEVIFEAYSSDGYSLICKAMAYYAERPPVKCSRSPSMMPMAVIVSCLQMWRCVVAIHFPGTR